MLNNTHISRLIAISGVLFTIDVSANEIRQTTLIEASSEPVPISEMIDGWEGNASNADLAYADGRLQLSAEYSNVVVGVERRWYYRFGFTPDTVDWYLALDNGDEFNRQAPIKFDVSSFDSRGVFFGYKFDFDQLQVTPTFTLYKIGSYQFGKVNGLAFPGTGRNASVFLDYHYDEDKLLEYNPDVGERYGYSLNVDLQWRPNDQFDVSLQVRDLWNLIELNQSAYQTGCINFGDIDQNVCVTERATVEGEFRTENYSTSIPLSLDGRVKHRSGWSAEGYLHDDYYRLTLGKSLQVGNTEVTLLASSLQQAGVRATWRGLSVEYQADDLRFEQVSDARLLMDFRLGW
ncbi:MAG: hypothetical protein P1U57_02860 [Oleibacter sp.]|nr:hypothetical protein [Thalassolituus sp.]